MQVMLGSHMRPQTGLWAPSRWLRVTKPGSTQHSICGEAHVCSPVVYKHPEYSIQQASPALPTLAC